MIEIEKGVPMPSEKQPNNKYPFAAMVVGDSFVVGPERAAAVLSACHNFGNRNEMKFATAKLPDGSRRVWRVE